MKTTMFSLVILILIFSLGGCYTRVGISADEVIAGTKKAVTQGEFCYNSAEIGVINGSPGRTMTIIIGNESCQASYGERIFKRYPINLMPFGQNVTVPITVMCDNLRVATRDFWIRSQNNKPVTTWVAQVVNNQIHLFGN